MLTTYDEFTDSKDSLPCFAIGRPLHRVLDYSIYPKLFTYLLDAFDLFGLAFQSTLIGYNTSGHGCNFAAPGDVREQLSRRLCR